MPGKSRSRTPKRDPQPTGYSPKPTLPCVIWDAFTSIICGIYSIAEDMAGYEPYSWKHYHFHVDSVGGSGFVKHDTIDKPVYFDDLTARITLDN